MTSPALAIKINLFLMKDINPVRKTREGIIIRLFNFVSSKDNEDVLLTLLWAYLQSTKMGAAAFNNHCYFWSTAHNNGMLVQKELPWLKILKLESITYLRVSFTITQFWQSQLESTHCPFLVTWTRWRPTQAILCVVITEVDLRSLITIAPLSLALYTDLL